jgi:hypothetical protein
MNPLLNESTSLRENEFGRVNIGQFEELKYILVYLG